MVGNAALAGSEGEITLLLAPCSLGGSSELCRQIGGLLRTFLVEFVAETRYSCLGFVAPVFLPYHLASASPFQVQVASFFYLVKTKNSTFQSVLVRENFPETRPSAGTSH